VPVAELEVRGLGARFRNPGIGAPLAASVHAIDPSVETNFLWGDMKVPVTAVLRIDDARRQIAQPEIGASLRVYNYYDVDSIDIAGSRVPLETEPSATLAYALSRSPIWGMEAWGFLRGDLVRRSIERPLVFVEPYRPGRIPRLRAWNHFGPDAGRTC
jgi:hypothetical protein